MKAKNRPSAPHKKGFTVPWSATVELGVGYRDMMWSSSIVTIKTMFICPAAGIGETVPGVTLDGLPSVQYNLLGDGKVSMDGATYSECCSPLGIFRQAFCYLSFSVHWSALLLHQESLNFKEPCGPSHPIPPYIPPSGRNFAFIGSDGKVYADPSTFAGKLAKFPTTCSDMFSFKDVSVARNKAEILSFL